MVGVLPVANFAQSGLAISILTSNPAHKAHAFHIHDPDSLRETYNVLQCFLFLCIIPLDKFSMVLLRNCSGNCANTAKVNA
jgi:hypothetical protein